MTDAVKIIESQQVFAKNIYLDFMSKRFGITPCCITDLEGSKIKKQLCDWNELKKDIPTITSITSEIFIPSPYAEPNFPCLDPLAPSWCRECGYFFPENGNDLLSQIEKLTNVIKELCAMKDNLEEEIKLLNEELVALENKATILDQEIQNIKELIAKGELAIKEFFNSYLNEGCPEEGNPTCELLLKQIDKATMEVKALEEQLNILEADKKALAEILDKLRESIRDKEEELEATIKKIEDINNEIAAINSEFCDDSECITVTVIDEHGDPVEGYDIVIDGGNVGATDSTGSVYYDVPNASVDTDHTLQICYCFDTKGGCRQQKITMVVNTGKDKPVCEVLESCDQIEVTNIIETTVNTFVCNTNNTRTE